MHCKPLDKRFKILIGPGICDSLKQTLTAEVHMSCRANCVLVMLQVIIRLFGRLFDNLLRRCGDIASSLHARGFVDASSHTIYTGSIRSSNTVNDIICLAAICLLIAQSVFSA